MLLHFAYGSNMDRALMRAHCPSARPVGTASLAGHRFIIAAAGYASIQPSAGSTVHGVVWRLTRRDVEGLDRYESVGTGLYDREMLSVRTHGGRMSALIYIACARAPGRPKPGYLELVLKAAREWQLPGRYVHDMARWAGASAVQGEIA